MGGIACIQIISDDELMNIVPIGNDKFKTVPHWGCAFSDMYSTIDTIDVSEELKNDSDGTHYEVKITGFIPESAEIPEADLDVLTMNKWCVMAQDNDTRLRVFGMPNEGLNFAFVYDPGVKPENAKGYTYTFSGKQRKRSKRL